MTQGLAVEWGKYGIRLNGIAPGSFPTEGAWSRLLPNEELAKKFETRSALGRSGDLSELANLSAYLMSDGSGFMTGECVAIDAGRWLQGAGQFTWVGDSMDERDWEQLRRRESSRRTHVSSGSRWGIFFINSHSYPVGGGV